MKLLGGLVLLVALLYVVPAPADQIYDLSGTATIAGNDSCAGQCVETITFSFSLDEFLDTADNLYEVKLLPGETDTISGPVPVTFADVPGERIGGPQLGGDWVQWDYSSGNAFDEIDVGVGCDWPQPSACAPDLAYSTLSSCETPACQAAFCPPANCGSFMIEDGTITGTVTDPPGDPAQTPEPGMWGLLALGLSLLGIEALRGKRHTRSGWRFHSREPLAG